MYAIFKIPFFSIEGIEAFFTEQNQEYYYDDQFNPKTPICRRKEVKMIKLFVVCNKWFFIWTYF